MKPRAGKKVDPGHVPIFLILLVKVRKSKTMGVTCYNNMKYVYEVYGGEKIVNKLIKYISISFLLCFSTQSVALPVGLSCNTLSPPLSLKDDAFMKSLTVRAICRYIEKNGFNPDALDLAEVCSRLGDRFLKGLNITVLPHEVTIDIPEEQLAVRYFDPENANVLVPYSDVSKLRTQVINDRLYKQVVYRTVALHDPDIIKFETAAKIACDESPPGIRPLNKDGRPGQLINMGKSERVIVIGDIHTYLNGLNAVEEEISKIPQGEIESENIHIVLLGDFMQTLNEADFDNFKKNSNPKTFKYKDYEEYEEDVEERTYKTILKVAELQNKYGNRFHVLTGNSELGFIYKSAFGKVAGKFKGREKLLEVVKGFVDSLPQFAVAEVGGLKYLFSHGGIIPEEGEDVLGEEFLVNWERYGIDQFKQEPARKNALDEIKARAVYYAKYTKDNEREIIARRACERLGVDYQVFGHIHLFGEKYQDYTDKKKEKQEGEVKGKIEIHVVDGKQVPYGTTKNGKMHIINSLPFNGMVTYLEITKDGPEAKVAADVNKDDYIREREVEEDRGKIYAKYVDDNAMFLAKTVDQAEKKVLRIPLEVLEGVDSIECRMFLNTLQEDIDLYLELFYMSGIDEVPSNIYQKYGIKKRNPPNGFKYNRQNTVTLLPVLKGEDITSTMIRERIGVKFRETLITPVGLLNDSAGILRSVILGIRMMEVAKKLNEIERIKSDREVGEKLMELRDMIQTEILLPYRDVCKTESANFEDIKGFDLSPDDIIAIVSGTVNDILPALRKLIRLLPIVPMNTEALRNLYEYARQVLLAA